MPRQFITDAVEVSTAVTAECDCYVHQFGAIAPGCRPRGYPSDMTDAEWAEVRRAMPVRSRAVYHSGRTHARSHPDTYADQQRRPTYQELQLP